MMVMMYKDCFSKKAQLVPLHESDACNMAEKFLRFMVSQQGLPEYITNNHDPSFCGHFGNKLVSLLDITITFSSALQPQSNVMAKVANCTME